MWVMELAIVGTLVEVEDEVEEEFWFTDAMEAKLWYHEQRSKTKRNWSKRKTERDFDNFIKWLNQLYHWILLCLYTKTKERERERERA